jgi:RHS repeat-associated protein
LYSIADPNWNVVGICDAYGNVQERYTYDAFGKLNVFDTNFVSKIASEFNWNRAFTGQVIDFETDMMLYRERFYHVKLGRYLSRDLIEMRRTEGFNDYCYTKNCSINLLDFWGRETQSETNCRIGCEEDCYEKYGKGWWYPGKYAQYIACINYCPSACATADQSLACTLVHPFTNNSSLQCICLLLYVADVIPGIGIIPGIDALDCACNILSTVSTCCDKGTAAGIGYGLATALDCVSLVPGCEAGAAAGGVIGSVPGALIGCLLGTLLFDPVIDLVTFAIQNAISQGTISPNSQMCDCFEILGII